MPTKTETQIKSYFQNYKAKVSISLPRGKLAGVAAHDFVTEFCGSRTPQLSRGVRLQLGLDRVELPTSAVQANVRRRRNDASVPTLQSSQPPSDPSVEPPLVSQVGSLTTLTAVKPMPSCRNSYTCRQLSSDDRY